MAQRKARGGVILLLVALLVLVSVQAVPPVLQTSADKSGELVILYPNQEHFKLGVEQELHFHILNSSGKLLTGEQAFCYIYIYNESNNHIKKENLTQDGEDYRVKVNLSTKGTHPYNIWCNSSESEYGYLSTNFIVTHYGETENSDNKFIVGLIALIPLVIGFFLILGAISLGDSHAVVKWFLLLLSPALGITSLHYATLGLIRFYNMPELQDAIGSTVYWFGIVWGVIIAYLVIYGIIVMVHTAAQKKEEKLNY